MGANLLQGFYLARPESVTATRGQPCRGELAI